MLSLVTISPVITAFHSCCLSHHVFDQVNLWPAWVGSETTIFWQCSPGTVETQRLYPLCHGPQRSIKVGFFGLINPIICSPYLVFHSQVGTEFVIVFIGNPFEMRLLNLRINFLFIADNNYWGYGYKTQHSYPRLWLITWRRPEVKFGWNIVKKIQKKKKSTKMRTKSPQWIRN